MKARLNLFLVGLFCGMCNPGSSFGAYAWFSIGPTPIHDPSGIINNAPGGDTFGRVSAIAVDPSNGSHWLLGAAQGGIWASTDGGDNWSPVADNAPSLAIGAITFAPGSPLIVYAGTGEGNFAFENYAGMGLLKSTNGGNTWSLQAGAPFAQTAFSAIKVNSANSDYLVAATVRGVLGRVEHGTNIPPSAPARGVFVSHDGGTTFTQTLTGEATDVDVDPGNFNHQYAALGEIHGAPTNGVYRSTDGGMSWSLINGPWTAEGATNLGRIRVAIAPSNPNRAYVSVAFAVSVTDFLWGLFRTDNAWDPTPTWTDVSAGLDGGDFPWYSQALLVHPANPDVLYYAGHDVWRYDNSTGIWTSETDQHADQHALAWSPNFNHTVETMLVGHDGGLSSRVDDSGSWVSRGGVGRKLSITQFYRGAVHPHDGFPVLGGSQDNGTSIFNGGTPLAWNEVGPADGYSCLVADTPPFAHYMATSYQGLAISRTQDGINWIGAGVYSEGVFFGEFVMHPAYNDVCLAGTYHLWLCPDFFSSWGPPQWFADSPEDMFYPDGSRAQITAIAFAPSDLSANTYAYGGEDGELRLTVDAGTHWININAGGAVPGRYVSGLAFSPTDPNTLYVTLSGFNASTPGHSGHVFETTDALAASPAWTDVSPPVDQPMDCIAIDPTDSGNVFVGSDFGVWNSPNGAVTWAHQGTSMGLPNMAVFDLQFDQNGHLTAFTHGRGAYAYTQVPIIIPQECIPNCFITWLNPGDPVEFSLPLWNEVNIPTGDLTATLRNTGEIVPLNGTQTQHYGSLSQLTGTVARTFQFTAPISGGTVGGGGAAGGHGDPGAGSPGAASCGATVYAIFDLTDGGVSLGSISIPLHVGTLMQPLLENFEAAAMPALPPGWNSDAWNTTSNAPLNVLATGDPGDLDAPTYLTGPVSISAFAPDLPNGAGNSLYSPVIPILTDQAQLSFRQSFDMASNLDGGVLEISISGQAFTDIVTAGGSFTQNGYNATLAAGAGPLGGRPAWSQNSGGWLITDVTLPPQALQQSVQFRWRLGAFSPTGGNGWFIDDVSVNEYVCLPRLSISTGPTNTAVISWPDAYASWALQQNTSVSNPASWTTPSETIFDNGTNKYITVSPALGSRFFRLRSP